MPVHFKKKLPQKLLQTNFNKFKSNNLLFCIYLFSKIKHKVFFINNTIVL